MFYVIFFCRFKSRDHGQAPPPGNTRIKPGTVTLTQEQLAALLASLGKTDLRDNPLKISIGNTLSLVNVPQNDLRQFLTFVFFSFFHIYLQLLKQGSKPTHLHVVGHECIHLQMESFIFTVEGACLQPNYYLFLKNYSPC